MSDPTVIIARSGPDNPSRRDFEAALIESLSLGKRGQEPFACRPFDKLRAVSPVEPPEGCCAQKVPDPFLRVLVVPSIYWLKDPSPALRALKEVKGGLVVAAWLYPRAIYWILRYHGVNGQLSSQPVGNKDVANNSSRPIYCLNLADYATAEACSQAIIDACGHPKPSKTRVDSLDLDTPTRWYPVMDLDSCINCKQCHDFCLFGVYELDPDGQVRVANPDSCKPGCPACARICPEGAIMFPQHEPDARIAGDLSAEPTEEVSEDEPEPSSGDELDQLIDELDKLDE